MRSLQVRILELEQAVTLINHRIISLSTKRQVLLDRITRLKADAGNFTDDKSDEYGNEVLTLEEQTEISKAIQSGMSYEDLKALMEKHNQRIYAAKAARLGISVKEVIDRIERGLL